MNNIKFIFKYNLIEKWEKPFDLRLFDHYFRCFKEIMKSIGQYSLLDGDIISNKIFKYFLLNSLNKSDKVI